MILENKVVVVTGATRGIGRGIARLLAHEGAVVVLSGRNVENGNNVLEQLHSEGGRGTFIQADVSVAEDCFNLIDRTVETYGRIDGLVNNAGIFPYNKLSDVTPGELNQVLTTNLCGAFFCAQRAILYMQKQGSGSIVNIESTHWDLGSRMLPAYAMSKGALHTMTDHIAYHYSSYGIRCNGVIVGWVLSEGERGRMLDMGMTDEDIAAEGRKKMPSGKFQTDEDIGNACLFLLSDASEQVLATHIAVTGGFSPNSL